ncbi:MAG: lysylphosphatidylglycerol synthase transmembrane domain-containing protein [Candidatus Zixiibacteriota bacterium]
MNKKTRKILITTAKILVAMGLIIYLYKTTDIEQVKMIWEGLDIWDLVLVTVVFMLTIFIGAFRSIIFFRGMDIDLSYLLYAKLYYIGYFFNNFIPSGVGGDVMRGWIAGKRSENIKGSYSAILAERISGLLATVFIGLLFMLFIPTPKVLMLIIGGLNLGLWIIIFILLMPRLTDFIKKYFAFLPFGIADKLSDFAAQVSSYRQKPMTLLAGFGMSVLYQMSIIFSVWVASLIIDSNVTFAEMCVIAPLVWTISMIPAAPNAIGIRETSFAKLFVLFGYSDAKGAFVGALFLFVSLICGIIGGIMFAIDNMIAKKQGKLALDHIPSEEEVEEKLPE